MASETKEQALEEYEAREFLAYDLFLQMVAAGVVSLGAAILLPSNEKILTLIPVAITAWQYFAIRRNRYRLGKLRERYPDITDLD